MIKPTQYACLFLFFWSFSLNAQQAIGLNKDSITVSKMYGMKFNQFNHFIAQFEL